MFVDQELSAVEAIETRAASEALAQDFQALFVALSGWLPDVHPDLTVLDARTLARLDQHARGDLLAALCDRTPEGGVHCVRPTDSPGTSSIEPDELAEWYREWHIDTGTAPAGGWFVARRPLMST